MKQSSPVSSKWVLNELWPNFAICFSVLHKFTDDQKEKWFWNFPNFEMVESWEELMTFFSSQQCL